MCVRTTMCTFAGVEEGASIYCLEDPGDSGFKSGWVWSASHDVGDLT